MEFRYRAIDDSDRPPPPAMDDKKPSQSTKPKFSFFSASSIPRASEVDVHEAIRRELEKEQILLQIIIAEASRKRDLIAEVLQDMSMERDMATRRVSDTGMSKLEENLTLLINQMKHPNLNQNPDTTLFRQKCNYIDPKTYSGSYNSLLNSAMMLLPQLQQKHGATGTSAMTSNNEKFVVLNRADTIGAKHGTVQLPQLQLMHEATGTSTLESNKEKLIVLARADSVGAKRKAEDTETGMNKNLKGKKQKAEGVLEGKKMSLKTGEIVSSKVPCLRELGSGKEVESKQRSSFKFWCEICGVGSFSERVMRNHELGKKHKAAVTQRNKTASSSLSPTSVTAPQAEAIIVSENGNEKAAEMSKKTESEKKKKGRLWCCETCNVKTNSEELMRYHKLGKKHRKNQRLLYEEDKTKVIEDC